VLMGRSQARCHGVRFRACLMIPLVASGTGRRVSKRTKPFR
jgi:hypothetical protein